MATPQERPSQPSLPWRITSAVNVGVVGFLCRSFLYGFNHTHVRGLDQFLELLDRRRDEETRTKGLITVSNHVSVLDDPLIWGVLPNRYFWNPNNMRWSLGSYDICFKNKLLEAFFSYGNTLPTHRAAYSRFGGVFQPTITQAIRLLSDPHAPSGESVVWRPANADPPTLPTSSPPPDPFTVNQLTYSTTGSDRFPAPAAYPSRRFSWVHIFPEGMIHQHPDKVMRYFKWGVARLILEAEPCPDVLPMWIDGPQHVMDNNRPWPRPLPRAGQEISITFGDPVDTDEVFEPFRRRWRELKEKTRRKRLGERRSGQRSSTQEALGELQDEDLKYGKEAEQLRIDVTLALRNEVLKVRRSLGLPDEDPRRGLAETFRAEGGKEPTREPETKKDGSVVQDW